MYIERLKLKDFRNYNELDMDFSPGVNLILGENAQGKTNIIEAIYMSSFGKSFRTSKDGELIRFNQKFARVSITAKNSSGSTDIDIVVLNGSKKSIKKDGIPLSRTSELLNHIYIVVFSPEDLKIVKDEPEKRRKFIDRELCQISPKYCDCLAKYKKSLQQRNAYLKGDKIDEIMLDLWDQELAKYGAVVMKIRERFIEQLEIYSSRIHGSITAQRENLKIKYDNDVKLTDSQSLQKDQLIKKLLENRQKDIRNRTTSVGPHRDDISFFVNSVEMRKFGSQGQQRTCALSLKLAELDIIKEETGEEAVLLLDDVMSELDLTRQEYLIRTLKNNQLFVTTTEIDSSVKEKFKNARIFYIENGSIKKTI